MVHSEVIVVGSGGAGAMAALAAASAGAQVLLLTTGTVGRSGLTPTGNGGYVAPLHPRDNPEDLCKHLVRFGHYLNDQNLVETLVNEAVAGLKRLEALGVTVRWPAIEDVPPGGRFPRSVLVPGTEVLRILRRHLYSSSSVKVVEDVTVTKLLTHDGAVVGCAGYDGRSGACFLAFGKALVLATGGLGELWSVSTNAPMGISTGSYGWGYSMAAEVGAELIDMEQIQFLPVPAKPRLGRNVRYLPHGPFENGRGERFLARDLDPYSPDLVLAIWQQCTKGLGPVRIDLTSGATPSYFEGSDHPAFRRKLRTFERLGVDPRQQPVELAIGSHYCQGGVHIDERCATNVPGLFVAGEVAGGVMGACRAGGAAFADIIVFGWRAGQSAARYAKKQPRLSEMVVEGDSLELLGLPRPRKEGIRPREVVAELRRLMDTYCGVVRDGAGLEKCLAELGTLRLSLDLLQVPKPGIFDLSFQDALAVRHMVECAEMIVRSALARTESLGCHIRLDCPEQAPGGPVHTTITKRDGKYELGSKPVVIKWLKPGE